MDYMCTVTNTGAVTGDAVVLGFINSTEPQFPKQKLFDFARVTLAPGASQTVLLTVAPSAFSVVDQDGRQSIQPSVYTVRVGDVVTPAMHTFETFGNAHLLDDYSGIF